ncbi:hypothetical protein CONLIGDRAFT_108193 [Coniochaeta ligniaria NRRL 30616]|uniref:Secreted protein n=1 Tax=Coniochaeta ligniaria NRRL 30616 TaxID=1408157 RepID=A0A1J7I9W0_9PEZI|nr:hypothetical protein CONLIGDRAFT_108193 [Coniochaeta ligniaria NRRL 30616]
MEVLVLAMEAIVALKVALVAPQRLPGASPNALHSPDEWSNRTPSSTTSSCSGSGSAYDPYGRTPACAPALMSRHSGCVTCFSSAQTLFQAALTTSTVSTHRRNVQHLLTTYPRPRLGSVTSHSFRAKQHRNIFPARRNFKMKRSQQLSDSISQEPIASSPPTLPPPPPPSRHLIR